MNEPTPIKVAILSTADIVIYKEQPTGWKDPLFIRKNDKGNVSFYPVGEYNEPGVLVDPPQPSNVFFTYKAGKDLSEAREEFLRHLTEAHKNQMSMKKEE